MSRKEVSIWTLWLVITIVAVFAACDGCPKPEPSDGFLGEVQDSANIAAKYHAQTEVRLPDGARCDLVNETYAIECEYPKKWAESIGQCLYYSIKLNKKPAVLFFVADKKKEQVYINRCKTVAEKHGITVFEEDLGAML